MNFTNERNENAVEMLLENLTKFHSYAAMKVAKEPSCINELKFSRNKDEKIRNRLNEFSPFLVFKEDWFNLIVYNIIKKNFPVEVKFDSPQAPDCLLLMAYKFSILDKRPNIPLEIYLGILSFLFEMILGKGNYVPRRLETERAFLFGKMIQSHVLPKTSEFYYDHLRNTSDCFQYIESDRIIRFFEFLSTKPTFEMYNNFFEQNEIRRSRFYYIYLALLEIRSDAPFSYKSKDPLYNHILRLLYQAGPNAASLIKKLPEGSFQQIGKWIDSGYAWLSVETFKAFNFGAEVPALADEKDPVLVYLWSRDYEQPFDIEHFQRLINGKSIEQVEMYGRKLVSSSLYFVIKLNIAIKIEKMGESLNL